MLTMLVCATRWLPVHLYTLAYMSMHETCLLVCCPCFNTMKLWTSNPNLHLSLVDTTFCLFSCLLPFCLFACFIVSLIAMPIILICFIPFHMLFASLLSIACLLVSCLCLCMYTCMERGHLELGHSLPSASKKGTDASIWLSQATVFSRLWLCTLLNRFLPPLILS